MTSPSASVIICSYNPKPFYLEQVLEALKRQKLQLEEWELLLIDNASKDPLANRFDLSWHPFGRHVFEGELGLTPARLRGIAEAAGRLIIFVDDDNLLDSNYLIEALRIEKTYHYLGAWGAGSIEAEFEIRPEAWVYAFLEELAVRRVDGIRWSNDVNDWLSTPVGAGQCVRKYVADRYREQTLQDTIRKSFDRRGDALGGAGDLDLAYTSRAFDLGWGNFPSLCMRHLIPPARTTKEYMLRISEAAAESLVHLGHKTGRTKPQLQPFVIRSVRAASIAFRQGTVHMQLFLARQRGIANGLRKLSH
jgi:glycosyltransferase involved in cell wall biosynthesis